MGKMKIRILLALTAAALIAFTMTSCYYDSEEFLYPEINSSCDTTNITYGQTITKIISENCLACHGASYESKGGGISLSSYANVKDNLNEIIGAVNHKNGYKPMPENGSKLSDCLIKQIEIWKNNGSPNN